MTPYIEIRSDGYGCGTKVIVVHEGGELDLTDTLQIQAVEWSVGAGGEADATIRLVRTRVLAKVPRAEADRIIRALGGLVPGDDVGGDE